MQKSFKQYYTRFSIRLFKDAAPWARDNILWGVLILVLPPLAVYLRHPNASIDWHLIVITLYLYGVVLGIYLISHILRTPWRLDLARQSEVEAINAVLEERNSEIAKKKAQIEELNWPSDRPVVQFVNWGDNPEPNNFNQSGFFLVNTGGACLEVQIQDFKVGNQPWGGEKVSGITPNETRFLLVWNGQGNPFNRFDLLRSMKEASTKINAIYQPDFSVPVSALFRDSKNLWYRAKTQLTYIHSQNRLRFEPTTIERVLQLSV
jgi:hypothetical protein